MEGSVKLINERNALEAQLAKAEEVLIVYRSRSDIFYGTRNHDWRFGECAREYFKNKEEGIS